MSILKINIMRKLILSFILLFVFASSVSGQYLKKVSIEELSKINKDKKSDQSAFGFSESSKIPAAYSLEKYCLVSDQENSSSCTGFAVANGAMSIVYNMVNGITRENQKWVNRFDPYYIYCALKDGNNLDCLSGGGCNCGSMISEALDIVVNYGCKKLYLYPDLQCNVTLSKGNLRSMVDITGAYSIDKYYSLFDYKQVNGTWTAIINIEDMKAAISQRNPIMAGINVDSEFASLNPEKNKYSAVKGMDGRHAVTIVGYDDTKYGGAFRILNSYGTEWGDNGFFWMTYKDFKAQADEAYVIWKDNWDDWRSNITDVPSFYKGPAVSSDKSDRTWEGPTDSEGNFHGRGIIVGKGYSAIGTYNHGDADGWWAWYDDEEKQDAFNGLFLFKNGKLVDVKEFGFASSDVQSVDELKSAWHYNNFDTKLSNEPASIDDLREDILNQINKKFIVTKTNK